MFNYMRKLFFSIFLSVLFVFLPFSDVFQTFSCSSVKEEVKVERQVDSFVSYSICNAATNNNKYAKSKKNVKLLSVS